MKTLGKHILADFFNCDPAILDDVQLIETFMKRAALRCGATIISSTFHMFNPHGVSGVVVIAESHLAIHTWPEYGYAAVDVFTCGETVDPDIASESLKASLRAEKVKIMRMERGELDHSRVLPQRPVIAE